MDYQKPIYFTITAPSLDVERSIITVVSSEGTAVDWCRFSHFEQIDEETWRMFFIVTKPYHYIIGEESVRYAYVSGILYSQDDNLCKKIKIEDDIRIKQEGCLFEDIEPISSNIILVSQGCGTIEFLNVYDTVYSYCSDEKIEAISSPIIIVEQECEDVILLVSYETILRDECEYIMPLSMANFVVRQECESIKQKSSAEYDIIQTCLEFVDDKSSKLFTIEQSCENIRPKSSSEISISQTCETGIVAKSSTAMTYLRLAKLA